MQGTWHVRSLIRLFIGAALLCLAWVVLTSGYATAAERPAPTQPVSDLVGGVPSVETKGPERVLGGLLTKPVAPAESPADPASQAGEPGAAPKRVPAQKPSAATTSDPKRSTRAPIVAGPVDEVVRQVAPVLEQVDTALTGTVDSGLDLVTNVPDAARELPLAGQPVSQLADAVVGLVRTLPVVGVPAPIAPLPIGDGAPTDVVVLPLPVVLAALPNAPSATLPTPADTFLADHGRVPSVAHAELPQRGASTPSVAQAASSGDRGPAVPGTPLDSAPALPSQPSPTGGSAPNTGDQAIAAMALVLPNPSMFGRSSADWRVPRGLPAHPGTQPD